MIDALLSPSDVKCMFWTKHSDEVMLLLVVASGRKKMPLHVFELREKKLAEVYL